MEVKRPNNCCPAKCLGCKGCPPGKNDKTLNLRALI